MQPRLLLLLVLGACAEDIAPTKPDASAIDPDPDAAVTPTGKVTTTRRPDGSYVTVIDATSTTGWTHADFETGGEVDATAAWDLRFQRFHISTNGGVSGSGGVEIALVRDTAFADITTAPGGGYFSDAADGDDPNTEPGYAFEQGDGWYDYNPMTHVLTPKPAVWIVRTAGGSTLKAEITDYYDAAGTAAVFSLHWGTL